MRGRIWRVGSPTRHWKIALCSLSTGRIGTLCVADLVPRQLGAVEIDFLRQLGCAASAIVAYHHDKEEKRGQRDRAGDAEANASVAWTCKADGSVVEMDARLGLLLDRDPDGSPGIDWISIAHAMERERVRVLWIQAVEDNVMFDAEFRVNDRAGSVCWTRARIGPPADEHSTGGHWRGSLLSVSPDQPNALRSEYLSSHDVLTGLSNRFSFQIRLNQAIEDARHGESFALLCLDLDDFKTINDTLGHQLGDDLLRNVARRLRACVRRDDTVARIGGDEFVIIQRGASRPSDALLLAQRLSSQLRDPMLLDSHAVVISVSIGIALCPRDGGHVDLLLRNADFALYRAKSEGRGEYRLFKPTMDSAVLKRRAMKFDLRNALDRDELSLVFQPIVSLARGRAASVEALLRWQHPERGTVPPSEFIPVAESVGLITPIGSWVLRQACQLCVALPDDVRVSVNLSPMQFEVGDLVETVAQTLRDTRLDAARLELEITETLPLLDNKHNVMILRKLRELRVRTVLDDFGTGYSSLTYLRSFQFDKIKLDRAFIASMSQKSGLAIARSIIGLARDLGIEVTAEGVETREQFEQVKLEGCDEVQGYFMARPVRSARLFSELSSIRKKLEAEKPDRSLESFGTLTLDQV